MTNRFFNAAAAALRGSIVIVPTTALAHGAIVGAVDGVTSSVGTNAGSIAGTIGATGSAGGMYPVARPHMRVPDP